jgi:hypothetical protein
VTTAVVDEAPSGAPVADAPTGPPPDGPTAVEVVVLLTGSAIAVVAWVSLATAQLGVHGVMTVAALSLVSFSAVVLVVGRRMLRRVRFDLVELLTVAMVGLLAAFLFLPGFPYAVGDKDPGAYVIHGFGISREGSVWIDDPVLQNADDLPIRRGVRFPGLWPDQSGEPRVATQFYHLFSSLLATANDVAGPSGVFNLNPLLAVFAVLVFTLVGRRIAGPVGGVVVGVLLAANMLQVWQAKTPSTEILTQLMFGLALLAVVVALRTSWRRAALLGGLAIGVAYLTRPDGILFVGLAALAIAVLVATRKADDRVAWFAGGLAVTLPHGFLNAYVARPDYTLPTGIPRFPIIIAGLVLLALLAVAARRWWPIVESKAVRKSGGDRAAYRRRIGYAVAAAYAGFLLLLLFRPMLLGEDMAIWEGITFRTHDEENLRWLALFVTAPVILLSVAGVFIAARRPSSARWIVIFAGLPLAAVYLWQARLAPRMMWWGRRYIPSVLPVIILLAALALAWLIMNRRVLVKIIGICATGVVLVVFLMQSVPLRQHREWAGSFGLMQELSSLSGDDRGVYLWSAQPEQYDPTNLFGGGIWFVENEVSARLPAEPTADDVLRYQEVFPDARIFVMTSGTPLPPDLAGMPFEKVFERTAHFPFWEESTTTRPDEPIEIVRTVTAWHLAGSGEATSSTVGE